MRHKRLELSLREEPDPKSGASTNSANAALAFGKWCLQMSLRDIERTIASALPKTYLTIAFGDPRRDLVCKDTTII